MMEPVTFPIPSIYRCLTINQRNQLVILHLDRKTINLYTADPILGFKEVGTWKAPKASAQGWDTIHVTESGEIMLHSNRQETVVLDSQGKEVARWPARCLCLMAPGSSSRVVYKEGKIGDHQLHVHDASDHLNRLFSLPPQGKWIQPDVTIGTDGRFYVTDLGKPVLAAFSPTGKRIYERELTYFPGPVAMQGQSIYILDQLDHTVVYIHESGSGQLKKKRFTRERLGLGKEDVIRRVWTGEGGKLHIAVYNHTQQRILTFTNLAPSK